MSAARSLLNDAAFDPGATLLGAEQRACLQLPLLASPARWNVLAQLVMMGMVGVDREGVRTFSMDHRKGCTHERMDLVRFRSEGRLPNPVALTWGIHSNWANEHRIDDRQPDATVVASEFVATSLSSGGNGVAVPERNDELRAANQCVRVHNRERGYLRCAVTPKEWRTDFVVVDDVGPPGGRSFKRASFVVEAGSSRVHEG